MKISLNIAVLFLMGLAIAGCKKYADDYKGYLGNNEITYPGLVSDLGYNTGNKRIQLIWRPSPDPSITKYVITWNNGTDSLTVNATTHDPADSMTVIVPNLNEYVYAFKVIAHDSEGHVSIGQELNNVRVYGDVYRSTLLNRLYVSGNPYEFTANGSLKLFFNKADSLNTATEIKYTNTLGLSETRLLMRDSSSITLPNFKPKTPIQFRSLYIPTKTSIDTFAVAYEDFPPVYALIESDKSLFKGVYLPGDVGSAYGWELPYLWNNNYGEAGFHTPGQTLPFWFTIDLGVQTELAKMKIWQRGQGGGSYFNYGNPKRFEIWGTNDPNPNGDYSGWVKLASFTSVKPSGQPVGQNTAADIAFADAGEPFNFPADAAPVRYIRFKMLENWGGSNYFHALEFTFYKLDK